jgi:uncharacterized protein
VILSQIVRGAAGVLATPPGRLIDPELIVRALREASDNARNAIPHPEEGTMLTVIERMASEVEKRLADFKENRLEEQATDEEQNALLAGMLSAALFAGEEAVRHTPEQLAVLAEHGVVDAGALGLVVIVRGSIAGLLGEEVQLPEIDHYAPARTHDVHHEDSTYRWCTNFIVTGSGREPGSFVADLERLGDSVLVVGDAETLKVHVHTDDFEAAKAIFDGVGEISNEDIADMREQIAERDARLAAGRSAAVVVAAGGRMRAMFEDLGAVAVNGGSTLNPSTEDLLRGIESVPTDEVVLMPNSPNTRMAAEEAARLSEKTVIVVPSGSQQAALAVLPEMDSAGDAAENAERLNAALGRIRSGGVAPAVRDDADGRFLAGDAVGFIADEIVAWGGAGSTLRLTLERLGEHAEIVTVFVADDAPIAPDELPGQLLGGAEVEVHRGGQPGWWWLIVAE